MKLYGSIQENLVSAVRSARSLRKHPVHTATLKHCDDLLHYARRELASGTADRPLIEPLVTELHAAIASRARQASSCQLYSSPRPPRLRSYDHRTLSLPRSYLHMMRTPTAT